MEMEAPGFWGNPDIQTTITLLNIYYHIRQQFSIFYIKIMLQIFFFYGLSPRLLCSSWSYRSCWAMQTFQVSWWSRDDLFALLCTETAKISHLRDPLFWGHLISGAETSSGSQLVKQVFLYTTWESPVRKFHHIRSLPSLVTLSLNPKKVLNL